MIKLTSQNGDEPPIRIDCQHEAFRGTEYEGVDDFWVEIKPMRAARSAALLRKHTSTVRGREETDYRALQVEMFGEVVTGWSGFVDDDGAPRACNGENKALLANTLTTFCGCINAAADIEAQRRSIVRAEERKN